ncbi:MAG: putative short chain dehydrogenase [Francisellaceae bacterium]|nr:putative short chain dehydrogenase [Francisellaceae bacterium]
MKDFQNKVAVITGAASGIGKALAEKCVNQNMKVVLADKDLLGLSKIETELRKISTNIISVVTDVSNQQDIQNLVKKTLDAFKEVHLLFNHAGIPGPVGPIWETEITDLEQTVKCNLYSVIYGLKEFIPIMLKQNNECYIVNTSSGSGLHTTPNMSGYLATKYATVALSEALFFDLKSHQLKLEYQCFAQVLWLLISPVCSRKILLILMK